MRDVTRNTLIDVLKETEELVEKKQGISLENSIQFVESPALIYQNSTEMTLLMHAEH